MSGIYKIWTEPGNKSFQWMIFRLFAMSSSEILSRIKHAIIKKIWKYKIPVYKPNIVNFPKTFPIIHSDLSFVNNSQIDDLIEEAHTYLNHEWNYFGFIKKKEKTINWHRDFSNNIAAPLKFGYDINHRDEVIVGNIKIIWEKNRHHHLTVLAIAYYLTNDESYAEEIISQLKSWINQNPYLIGVNWTHPLEQGIRLISWVYCERFLRGSKYHETFFGKDSIFWKSVYEHQKFITKTHSIGSSANNHLIGEMAGLFISCINWPFFQESEKWLKFSKRILEKEIIKQSFPSGVNREMAFSYQIFVYEFFLLSYIEGKRFPDLLSITFTDLLIKNAKVIHDLTHDNQRIPNYGDGDEGMAIQLQPINSDRISWLLEITKSLFPELEFNFRPGNLPAQLLGYSGLPPAKINPKTSCYEDAGIYILNYVKSNCNISCLIKAGPFGYKRIAAHSHADSLSFELNINGLRFFVDPGTYCYHTDPEFRKYFRGTKAHNTLCMDQLDQSEQIGPFLWGRKAKTFVKIFSKTEKFFYAYHNGYKNIHAIHSRKIVLNDRLEITDEVSGHGDHILDFRFHLHPDVRIIDQDAKCLKIRCNDIQLNIINESGFPLTILTKSIDGGWYSPQFNVKVPTYTLSYQKKVSLPTKQIFKIEFNKI